MLRLDRLEISGFKSFSDRTDVRFPMGITAVVGPNGCGKSNIGDAINWALGEQSAKMLRGKHMADVIFNGSRRRKPLGMAEVSLYFSGAEGLKREDHGGIVVTRRLFRSGDSEYLLNGARSRLKDIQEILNQARVGARTYATIEQGKIDQILNAKPKDRRLLIEDSAGIAIYKHRRRLTELKLEATQANLLRVNDIVLEVERQIRSLKRQAAKARRYRKLRDELRTLERVQFGVRALAMDHELARVQRTECEARDRESEAAASLSRLDVEVLERRGELEGAGEKLTEAAERLHALEIEIDRDESQIRGCRERITESSQAAERQAGDAEGLVQRRAGTLEQSRVKDQAVEYARGDIEQHESRLAELQTSLDSANAQQAALREQIEALREQQFDSMNRAAELRNRLRNTEEGCQRNRTQQARLEAEHSEARDERSRLDNETRTLVDAVEAQHRRAEELSAELVRCESQLRDARERQTAEVEALAQAREREKSAAARLHTLEDVATRFAGVSDGVRALLSSGPAAGVQPLGVVADFVQAGRDVESAAEGYLQSFLPTVIVSDDAELCRAAELLQSEGAGRTTLISRSQPAGGFAVGTSRNGKGELPSELLNDPRVRGKLRDRLTLITSANGVVQDRVGDALLVDSLPAALELHRRHPAVDYLTPDGDVVYASGVVSARGRERGDQGLLAHTRRMQEARADAAEAAELTAGLQLKVKKGSDDVAEFESRLATCRQSAEEASKRKLELEVAAQRSTEDRERTGRRSQVLTDELAGLKEESERLEDEFRSLAEQVGESERSHGELELTLEGRLAELRERESVVARLAEEVADLRADLAARRQRQESVESEARRLAEELAELDSRIRLLEEEARQSRERERAARDLRVRT
jgi:chromosome segregation protein